MKLQKLLIRLLAASLSLSSLSACSLDQFWSQAKSWGNQVGGNVVDWASSTWDNVAHWGASTWNNVASWSTNAGEAVAKWGSSVIDGVKTASCQVGDFFISVKDSVVSFVLKGGTSLDLLKEPDRSQDWKSYIGDNDAIVYSLISTQLGKAYDVFPAKITLSDSSQEVYGYAFTDQREAYLYHEGQADQETYFASGFLALIDEPTISVDAIKSGLEIVRTDNSDKSDAHYFYSYQIEPFTTHCIADHKYFVYGVNDNQQIFDEVKSDDGHYRSDCGSLYSYDQQKYIVGEEDGFVPTLNSTVEESFSYDSWREESRQAITQGFSFSLDSLRNLVTEGIYTIQKVLKNLKEQTIFGETLSTLQGEASEVKENDIATVDENEVALHSSGGSIPNDVVRWLVGIATVLQFIVNIFVYVFAKQFAPLAGAISGAAMTIFTQNVLEKKAIQDINWVKVAIGALAGALSAETGIFGDAFIGAVSDAVFAFLDNKSFLDCALSFVSGFAISIVISVLFNQLTSLAAKALNKLAPNFTKKVETFVAAHQISLGGKTLDESEDSLADSLETTSQKASSQASDTLGDSTLAKAIRQLPSDKNPNFVKVDEAGKTLTKLDLYKNGGEGYLELTEAGKLTYGAAFIDAEGNPITRLAIVKGFLQFDSLSSFKASIAAISASRPQNFAAFDEVIRNALIQHDSSIPSYLYDYFAQKGIDLDSLLASDIKTMRFDLHLTWHEAEDGVSGYLVPSALHALLSHLGGVALAKASAALGVPVINLLLGATA